MSMSTELRGVYRDDVESLMHAVTHYPTHDQQGPLVIVSGRGIFLTDYEGKEYIDGSAGLWNVNVGHGRTEIADAVNAQIRKVGFTHTFMGLSHLPAIELARKLQEITPPSLSRTHFTSGGSETNETNFKIARYYHRARGEQGRYKIISRFRGYHGISMGALSATGLPHYWKMFEPMVPGFVHIEPPYCYRCAWGKVLGGCDYECAAALEATIEREGPRTVAAFIAEPVIGAGGVIPPPPEYFTRVADMCRKHRVLLLLDEVITGFGRTGKMFAAAHWNLAPDLASVAKGITSGYLPLGAAVISEEVYQTISANLPPGVPFWHGFTYSGHPVCCAAALANIGIIERENLVENARVVGDYFQARLREMLVYPVVGDARGLGLVGCVELVKNKATKEMFPAEMGIANKFGTHLRACGLLCRPLGNVLAFSPPLCITTEEVDLLVERLKGGLEAGQKELGIC